MTFTEAAVEVLRREGKPLHFKKIAEIAVRENLLDHVGKIPEDVMGGQLVDHCRLPHMERRVMAVQAGTFALVEWGLDEDPHGLENLIELPPDDELQYRPRERHPVPSRDMARSIGRGAEQRARRREEGEERRGKRFPPPADVAFEILAGADKPLPIAQIAALGAERMLMPDAFVRDTSALAAALAEDNRRREGSGKKALFSIDGDDVTLVAQPEPGERPLPAATAAAARAAPAAPLDARRAGLAALRRKLRECDAPTVEHVVAQLLEKLGYREVKVAKRGREHVVYTARKRMGLGDVRHGFRILRTGAEAGRRDVSELRRDLANYGAQIGVVVTAGEAARDARGEASAAGQLPIVLLCGEALAEAMAEAVVGCRLVSVPEVDEGFFREAAELAAQEESARRARRDEREKRDGERAERREAIRAERREQRREQAGTASSAVEAAPAADAAAREVPSIEVECVVPAGDAPAEASGQGALPALAPEPAEAEGPEDDDDEEGDDAEDGEPEAAAGPAAPGEEKQGEGEKRRRRRRRRRRGGRGRGAREGAAQAAPGAPGAPSEAAGGSPPAAPDAGAPSAPVAAAAPAPSREPGGEEPR